ncbi:MAG: response regulator [Bacteroidales bacterium]|jgi:PAS domain S-box-containing protein|nr:response regulator [Bacteroidales bacterium]MDD3701680.1 response regulator [Bacteroidales bacterium]MDY0369923.1 response regulator [Bacteroidales bacterium]
MNKKTIIIFHISIALTVGAYCTSQAIGFSDDYTVTDYLYLSKAFETSSPDQAWAHAQQAILLARQLQSDSLLALSFRQAGQALAQYPLTDSALRMYDSALYYFTKQHKLLETGKVLNEKGILYAETQNYFQAIKLFQQTEKIWLQANNISGLGMVYTQMGTLFLYLKAYATALDYFNQAVNCHKQTDDFAALGLLYNQIAQLLTESQQADSAFSYIRQAQKIAHQTNDSILLQQNYLAFGNAFLSKKQLDSAFYYYSGLETSTTVSDHYKNAALIGTGRAHMLAGNQIQAIKAWQQAWEQAVRNNNFAQQHEISHEMYSYYKAINDPYNLYKWGQEYLRLDELKDNQTSLMLSSFLHTYFKPITGHSTAFDSKDASQAAQLFDRSHSVRKNTLIGLIVVSILLILLTVAIAFRILFLNYRSRLMKIQPLEDQARYHKQTIQKLQAINTDLIEKDKSAHLIFNALPAFVCLKDEFGRWQEANDAILQFLNLKDKDYLNKTDSELIELVPEAKTTLELNMLSEELCWQRGKISRSEDLLTNAQGQSFYFDTIRIPLFKADGSRKGIIFLGRDISHSKADEQSLQDIITKMDEANAMKTAFLTYISDEISLTIQMLQEAGKLSKQKAGQLSDIKKQIPDVLTKAQHNLTLIRQILDLGSLEAKKTYSNRSLIKLNLLFEEIHQEAEKQAQINQKTNVKLISVWPQNELILPIDGPRIRQLMLDMLEIAFAKTDSRSATVEFGFEPNKEEGSTRLKIFVHITFQRPKTTGMPLTQSKGKEDIHPSVSYDPIIQIKLKLVQRLSKVLNGSFETHEAEDQFFNMEIVFTHSHTEQSENNHDDKDQLFSKKRFLVVEDNNVSYELLKANLETQGARVERVTTGEEAIKLCEANQHFDLIIMDIQLPGLNGIEVTRRIKKINPSINIIAHTAWATEEIRDECFAAGCIGFLTKPIKGDLLIPVLKQILFDKTYGEHMPNRLQG